MDITENKFEYKTLEFIKLKYILQGMILNWSFL